MEEVVKTVNSADFSTFEDIMDEGELDKLGMR